MDPFTRQSGPWTISHVPAGHSAYDRVLGRLSAWSLEIAHDTGWVIVEHEGEPTAQIFSPGGLLVGVIAPTDYAGTPVVSLSGVRSNLLIEALTTWVHRNAREFNEPDIFE